jgi:hypothetical protein
MPISVTNPVNGQAMSWTSMASQFSTMRTWVNAVPLADVVDGSIQREHLVRPVIAGFPVEGMRSDFREHRWRTSNLTGPNLYARSSWTADRLTIVPDAADRLTSTSTSGDRWNTPIGAPLYGVGASARVWFSCSTLVRMDPSLFPGGIIATEDAPEIAGELQILTAVAGSLPVVVTHAVGNVWCGEWDGDPALTNASTGTLMSRVQLFAYISTAVDWVYVAFKRTRDDVDQVDLSRIAFHVEVS